MAPRGAKPKTGTVEKLPSGRYRVRITGPDGKRHAAPVTFEDKNAAVRWIANETKRIEDDPEAWRPVKERMAARSAKLVTFGEYAEVWLIGRKVRGKPLADRTRDHYRDLLDRFVLPRFAETPLISITPEDVDHWYELTAPDRPTTQAHSYGLLRSILGTAVDRGLIKTANPAKVRGGGTTRRAKKIKPASLSELKVIREAMPERRRLMVDLAAWCSLRFGELAELRRSDVDVKANVIHVRRGVVRVRATEADQEGYKGPKHVRKVKSPKTDAGIRDVPIPPHLQTAVKAHLLEHTEPGRNGLMFPGRTERDAAGNVLAVHHLTSSAFYGHVAILNPNGTVRRKGDGYFEARRQAGRDDLRFHDLRHTGLTNAAVAGATLAELMQLAGHSTSGAALRYQHAAADRMQDLAAKLSKIAEGGEA